MADAEPKDPNQEHDDAIARGKDHPNLSEADAWGTNLNPVRETPEPHGGLSDGGRGAA
jgi:hypothetical protein